ncbi:putative hydrolase of the HAD superfamily [Ectothiorhodospira magna]|uniref:Putative hydrolase of the HAD superfamily n=1 Tax=Ectothiorhodospira magna TaxID=867345 RepID=A0A1H9A8Q5_9GAMM|nr:HAD family hydrolase [Ectothiorhodospira magna]SEP73044.1 putative hydrolase of the HAD superfamily [Ectothiorhodospira magna]
MDIRCITFDLDDTLWDCAPVIQNAERVFHHWLGVHYPRIAERHSLEAMIRHRQAWFAERRHLHYDMTRLRKHWLRILAAQSGYGDELVEPAFRVFWEARNQVSLYDDVLETLDRLRGHFRIGAITNGNACVHHIGIGDRFDFVITSAAAGAAKPSARIFTAALDEAGVAASETLHVGDDAERDVRGAARVGMRAAWVNPHALVWEHGGSPPDLTLSSVSELPARLLLR